MNSCLRILFALFSTITFAACAGHHGKSIDADDATIATLKQQAEQWDQAIVRKDRAAIAANMSDDFRQIREDGAIADKQAFLDGITSQELAIDPYTVEDFDVRLYGDTALVSGHTHMTGRYAANVFRTHYRFIDVYVRNNGKWRVCSVQITTIAG